MGEGDEPQVAPVPLDRGVVLELQQADLEQPIDVILDQEGDEDHALRRLKDIALLQGLAQLRDVRHLLAPTVCPPRPSQRRLHLGDDGLPSKQRVVRRHVAHEALQAPAEVLHDAARLVASLGLRDELPDGLPQLAAVRPGHLPLEVLQAQRQQHATWASDQLQGVRAGLQRRQEALIVTQDHGRAEEALHAFHDAALHANPGALQASCANYETA
mmetsp:Transcript_78445/g.219875  ORF Transcript_78445/g.219875 Transcript_78445/m.219875 type:complete len:215 (-) Transcript_78445:2-646(-)